jgi:hypothetical protein
MPRKLELLATFFWIEAGLAFLGALLFGVIGVLGSLGILEPNQTLQDRLGGAFGTVIIVVVSVATGAVHLVTGFGLRRLRPWARTAGLVVGIADILCCCNAPVGTALGIFAVIVLLGEDVSRLFRSV